MWYSTGGTEVGVSIILRATGAYPQSSWDLGMLEVTTMLLYDEHGMLNTVRPFKSMDSRSSSDPVQ
jgi:hypothetical protein